MTFEGILGGLHAFLGLEPDEVELVLNVVDHDGLTLTTAFLSFLSGGVGTLQLEVLILALEVLPAVALPQDLVDLLDLEGVGEELVSGNDVLFKRVNISDMLNGYDCDDEGSFFAPPVRTWGSFRKNNVPCR